MNTSLWHLVGQIYCTLYETGQEVSEHTIADESKFMAILSESDLGLAKAYKKHNRANKETARALLVNLYPFESKNANGNLPEVVRLGIDPKTLHNLCETHGAEKVKRHIRYSYSEEGYQKALTEGKVDENIDLKKSAAKVVSTEVVINEAMYNDPQEVKSIADKFSRTAVKYFEKPSPEVVLSKHEELRTAARKAKRNTQEEINRLQKTAADDTEVKLKALRTAQENLDAVARKLTDEIAKEENKLKGELEKLNQQLQSLIKLAGSEAEKFKEPARAHQQFYNFVVGNAQGLATTLSITILGDIDAYTRGSYLKSLLPGLVGAKDDIGNILDGIEGTEHFPDEALGDKEGFITKIAKQILSTPESDLAKLVEVKRDVQDTLMSADISSNTAKIIIPYRGDDLIARFNEGDIKKIPAPKGFISYWWRDPRKLKSVFHFNYRKDAATPEYYLVQMLEASLEKSYPMSDRRYYILLSPQGFSDTLNVFMFRRLPQAEGKEIKQCPQPPTDAQGEFRDDMSTAATPSGYKLGNVNIKKWQTNKVVTESKQGKTIPLLRLYENEDFWDSLLGRVLHRVAHPIETVEDIVAWTAENVLGEEGVRELFLGMTGHERVIPMKGRFIAKNSIYGVEEATYELWYDQDPEEGEDLDVVDNNATIRTGWPLTVLFFDVGLMRYCVKRVYSQEQDDEDMPRQRVSYYLLTMDQYHRLRGASIYRMKQDFKNKFPAIFRDFKTVAEIEQVLKSMGESIDMDKQSALTEQDKEPKNPPQPPQQPEEEPPGTPEDAPDKPTEYVPTNRKERGEEGEPGEVKLPTGKTVTKEEARFVAQQVLKNVVTQLEQPAPKPEDEEPEEEETPEEPEEETEEDEEEEMEETPEEETEKKTESVIIQTEAAVGREAMGNYEQGSRPGGRITSAMTRNYIPIAVSLEDIMTGRIRDELPPRTEIFILSTWDSGGYCKSTNRSLYGAAYVEFGVPEEALGIGYRNHYRPITDVWSEAAFKRRGEGKDYYIAYAKIGDVMSATGLDEGEMGKTNKEINRIGNWIERNFPKEQEAIRKKANAIWDKEYAAEKPLRNKLEALYGNKGPKKGAEQEIKGIKDKMAQMHWKAQDNVLAMLKREKTRLEKKKKPKTESVARRLIGLRKSLTESVLLRPRIDFRVLQNLGRGVVPDRGKLIETIQALRGSLHPFVPTLVESDNTIQYLSYGMGREALAEALKLPGSFEYEPEEVALAIAQLNHHKSAGDFLIEQEDEDEIDAIITAPPSPPAEIPMPEPGAEEVMNGAEKIYRAEKLAAERGALPDEEGDTTVEIKRTIASPDVATDYVSGDEEEVARKVKAKIDVDDEEIDIAIDDIDNTYAPVADAATTADIMGAAPMPANNPSQAAPDVNIEAPPAVDINYDVPDIAKADEYEGYIVGRRGSICEVVTSAGKKKFSSARMRLMPPGSDLSSSIKLVEAGHPLKAARRRLYGLVRSIPLSQIPIMALQEEDNYLILYTTGNVEHLLEKHVNAYKNDGVVIFPVTDLSEEEKNGLIAECERSPGYLVASRRALRVNICRPLCEQMEVPEGDEANEAAAAFEDGMKVLQAARKALVDFEGISGKIVSLVSMDEKTKGKQTVKALDRLSKEVQDVFKEMKEVMDTFAEVQGTFSKEFPDASAEKAMAEEPEPAAEQPPAGEEPPKEEQQAPPAAPEKPATKAESVAWAVMSKCDLNDLFARSKVSTLAGLIIREDRSLRPEEVAEVVEILRESLC